jgi:hypothetical protein
MKGNVMNRPDRTIAAVLLTGALALTACGDDDEAPPATQPTPTEDSVMTDDSMTDDSITDDSMTDDSMMTDTTAAP